MPNANVNPKQIGKYVICSSIPSRITKCPSYARGNHESDCCLNTHDHHNYKYRTASHIGGLQNAMLLQFTHCTVMLVNHTLVAQKDG